MSAATKQVRLWWVSWLERESPDDPRPLRDPPGPSVIGWWCTGFGDGYATMVALVVAPRATDTEAAIAEDWPAKRRSWRFRNELDIPLKLSDRFPFKPWMLKRLEALGVEHDVEVAQ